MAEAIAGATLLVRDYDEAIAYFIGALGFRLVEDSPLGERHNPAIGLRGI